MSLSAVQVKVRCEPPYKTPRGEAVKAKTDGRAPAFTGWLLGGAGVTGPLNGTVNTLYPPRFSQVCPYLPRVLRLVFMSPVLLFTRHPESLCEPVSPQWRLIGGCLVWIVDCIVRITFSNSIKYI